LLLSLPLLVCIGNNPEIYLIQFANQILIVRFPAIGRTIRTIPTSTQTLDIKKTTVVDLNGNPIVVAGVVTFVLTDTIKAAFGNLA